MHHKKKIFTAEFKHEAAKAMEIGKSTLAKWVAQVRAEGYGIRPKGSAITPEQQGIKELEKRIKRVELENSLLKKATLS